MIQSDTLFETAYVATHRSASSHFATLRTLPIDRKRPVKRLMATLTAGLTAMSLLVATAMPAHADRQSDNLAKALIAAIAIGAIVNSIDKGRAQPAPAPVPVPVRHRGVVPAICAVEVSGARRDAVFYPERCLRREGFNARLPHDCAISIRMRGRTDRAYGERCLRDAGFRIGGGRRDHDDDWRRDDRGGQGYGRGRGGYGY